jgi:hypothetical protein
MDGALQPRQDLMGAVQTLSAPREFRWRGYDPRSKATFVLEGIGSCMEPVFSAFRTKSLIDRSIAPHSGERAALRCSRSDRIFEKYVINTGVEWVALCNECVVPLASNGLTCIGKTTAACVYDETWPPFSVTPLEPLDVAREWELLRMAAPLLDWLIAEPAAWQSDQSWHLRLIIEDLQARLVADARGEPRTTLVRWRAYPNLELR